MKAENLMIGDWVVLVDPDTKERKNTQIIGSDLCGGGKIPCEWFEPLPLTIEILEKNFAKDNQWVNAFFLNDHIHIFDTGEGFFQIQYAELFEIRYVHQLQHALKLWDYEKEIII